LPEGVMGYFLEKFGARPEVKAEGGSE